VFCIERLKSVTGELTNPLSYDVNSPALYQPHNG